MRSRLVALLLLAAASGAAAQFKWTDPDGRVTYGDNPPRDARNIERVGVPAPDDADPLRGFAFEVRRAAQTFPVVIYTTENCGAPCDAGRSLLQARGVPYSERTISSKEEVEQLAKLSGGDRVPVLGVGRQVQKEFETGAWHKLLDAAGYPRGAQLPRGWKPPAPRPLIDKPPVSSPATADAGVPGQPPAAPARQN